jgi:hypothetical protein
MIQLDHSGWTQGKSPRVVTHSPATTSGCCDMRSNGWRSRYSKRPCRNPSDDVQEIGISKHLHNTNMNTPFRRTEVGNEMPVQLEYPEFRLKTRKENQRATEPVYQRQAKTSSRRALICKEIAVLVVLQWKSFGAQLSSCFWFILPKLSFCKG